MKTTTLPAVPLLLAAAIALAPVARGQHPEPGDRAAGRSVQTRRDPGVVELDELELRHYTPEVAGADFGALFEALSVLHGRMIGVRAPDGTTERVMNLVSFAGSVVIYDTPDNAERIVATLRELQQAYAERAARAGAAPREAAAVVRRYTPRHVSLDTFLQALAPMRRELVLAGDERVSIVENVHVVSEANQIVVRETEANHGAIAKLLAEIDVPAPQVLLSCSVITAKGQAATRPAPGALSRHLAELVPFEHFELEQTSVLRTSVVARREVRIFLGADDTLVEGFELSFEPAAYDPETGTLALERCALLRVTGGSRGLVFETSTSIRRGEYTVLGSAGAEPKFLVLRMLPVEDRPL